MWQDVKRIIDEHSTFLITTHLHPDGDGIGASCALVELLLQKGKTVRFVCDSPVPKKFSFLDFYHLFEVYDEMHDYTSFEVLIVVDTHNPERIGALQKLLQGERIVPIFIDHHPPTQSPRGTVVIDPNACSAGAMVFALLKEYGVPLTEKAAMGVYTSILCDTGRFCYASTDRMAHVIAEECMKKGVDPDEMYDRLFRQVTIKEFKVLSNILQRVETYFDHRVILQQLSNSDYSELQVEGTDLVHSDLEYILEFNKLVIGVDCVVLLREVPEEDIVRVSLRSNSSLCVDTLCQKLGGGGHSKAAGATVKGTLDSVKKQVLSLIECAIH